MAAEPNTTAVVEEQVCALCRFLFQNSYPQQTMRVAVMLFVLIPMRKAIKPGNRTTFRHDEPHARPTYR